MADEEMGSGNLSFDRRVGAPPRVGELSGGTASEKDRKSGWGRSVVLYPLQRFRQVIPADQSSFKRVCGLMSRVITTRPRMPSDEFGVAPVPDTTSLSKLRAAAQTCRACPLWKNATCAVFGEGLKSAEIILVGEQPGDKEDRAGQPFIGPAGQLLDRALEAAGISRADCFVTNAVKHFKWTPQGKRRLHAKPSAREVAACRPWFAAEMKAIHPRLVVCLGSTAAQQVLGKPVKVTQIRGEKIESEFDAPALITVHPSSLLRAMGQPDAEEHFDRFVADLKRIRS